MYFILTTSTWAPCSCTRFWHFKFILVYNLEYMQFLHLLHIKLYFVHLIHSGDLLQTGTQWVLWTIRHSCPLPGVHWDLGILNDTWAAGKYRPWNAPAHVGLPPLVAHHLVHHKPLVDLGAHARNLRNIFQNLQNISLQTLKIHFPKHEKYILQPWPLECSSTLCGCSLLCPLE